MNYIYKISSQRKFFFRSRKLIRLNDAVVEKKIQKRKIMLRRRNKTVV